jgi:hypothetical protein
LSKADKDTSGRAANPKGRNRECRSRKRGYVSVDLEPKVMTTRTRVVSASRHTTDSDGNDALARHFRPVGDRRQHVLMNELRVLRAKLRFAHAVG